MPTDVFVNLPPSTTDGLELEAKVSVAAKNANDTVKRKSTWVVEAKGAALGGELPTFTRKNPVEQEAQKDAEGNRVFKNRVNFPPAGGNVYDVKVTKRNSGVGSKSADSVGTVGDEDAKEVASFTAKRKIYFTVNYGTGLADLARDVVSKLPGFFTDAHVVFEADNEGVEVAVPEWSRTDDVPELCAAVQAAPGADDKRHGMWLRLAFVSSIVSDISTETPELADLGQADVGAGSDKRANIDSDKAVLRYKLSADSPKKFIGEYFVDGEELSLKFAKSPDPKEADVAGCTLTPDPADWKSHGLTSVRITDAETVAYLNTWMGEGSSVRVKLELKTSATADRVHSTWIGRTDPGVTVGADAVTIGRMRIDKGRDTEAVDAAAEGGTLRVTSVKFSPSLGTVKVPLKMSGTAGAVGKIGGERKELALTVHDAFANRLLLKTLRGEADAFGAVTASWKCKIGQPYAGMSSGANISVATSATEDRYVEHWGDNDDARTKAQAAVLRATVHEIVHSLGGVKQGALAGFTHPKFYGQDLGGKAASGIGHCSLNAKKAKAADLKDHQNPQLKKFYEESKAEVFVPEDGKVPCIMLHRLFPPKLHEATLCPDCLKQLRLLPMAKSNLKNWDKVE